LRRWEEDFGPRLSRVVDSYLNLYMTGGRPTRAVLATFWGPASGRTKVCTRPETRATRD